MSKNINQIFIANPITSNTSTDLIYFGQSPYGIGNDAAMLYSNFSAQFLSSSTPVTASHGGTGVSNPTAHTLPVAEGSSNFNFLGPLTSGQLLIGSTGADPVAATLTAGSGINIINAAGAITISSTAVIIGSWNDQTTSTTMVVNNGYVSDSNSLVQLTLPTTAAFGTSLGIIGRGSGGWQVLQNIAQKIRIGTAVSTTGVGGSIASSNQFDSIYLICTGVNSEWTAFGGPQGNITVT